MAEFLYAGNNIHMEITCRRFHIAASFTFEMYKPKMFEIIVEKHTERMYVLKSRLCFKGKTKFTGNLSTLGVKNATFEGIVFTWTGIYRKIFKLALVLPLIHLKNITHLFRKSFPFLHFRKFSAK